MYRGASVGVVVPCYEEARTVAEVLTALPPLVDEAVAVDDGSSDGTVDEIRRAAAAPQGPPVDLVRHERNRGAGAAIATGYRRCRDADHDLVVTVDADGQMNLDRMADLLDPLVDGEADYAKGDRLTSAGHRDEMPPHRVAGNAILTACTRLASGCAVSDPQNGYTAVTRATLRSLDLDGLPDDHSYTNEVLVQLGERDATVADVPMPAIYGEESSTISYPRFVVTTLWVLTAGLVGRLAPTTGPGSDSLLDGSRDTG